MRLIGYIKVLLLLILICLSCRTGIRKAKGSSVYNFGHLDSIMEGHYPAVFSLDSLANMENVYALGAMDSLSGEIQIFNSQPYHSTIQKDSVRVGSTATLQAALLVYAQVAKWQEISMPLSVVNLEALVGFLEYDEQMNKFSSGRPLVFTIEGLAEQLDWHVLMKIEPDSTTRDHDHKNRVISGSLRDIDVEILGFYSREHQGVFTHHNLPLHLHFKTTDGTIAGHIDALELGPDMILKIPSAK